MADPWLVLTAAAVGGLATLLIVAAVAEALGEPGPAFLPRCAGEEMEIDLPMLRDAAKYASPNSGWPEAAMAGALGVQLGGPASYDGVPHQRQTFGEGARPSPLDLHRGLGLYLRACAILVAALALGGLTWPR